MIVHDIEQGAAMTVAEGETIAHGSHVTRRTLMSSLAFRLEKASRHSNCRNCLHRKDGEPSLPRYWATAKSAYTT
jgi:hypothetical protein